MFAFDGKSMKSIDAAFSDRWYTNGETPNQAVVNGLTTAEAYGRVPWLYRGVQMISLSVSRFPLELLKGEKDVIEDEAYAALQSRFRYRLFMACASQLLLGAGYWILDTNKQGRNITPRWIPTKTVTPNVDKNMGLVSFKYGHADIPLERMVYFWEPNLESENAPGKAPAEIGLGAASMLYALDAFAANYFNRGGVKVTVFEIPQATPEPDKQDFQNFLNRSMSGIRNAFKMLAVRGGVKPTVIGSDVKDTSAPELIAIQRDNIAAALNIPAAIMDGRSSDDSNHRSEWLSFYTTNVIPRLELMTEAANKQLYEQFGLVLNPRPDKLEVMQSSRLEQAKSVSGLLPEKEIISLNEGRALLELEGVGKQGDWPTEEQPTASELKNTVGGSQQILELQRAYYLGEIPRAAATANAEFIFGFSKSDAESLFPEKPPDAPTPEVEVEDESAEDEVLETEFIDEVPAEQTTTPAPEFSESTFTEPPMKAFSKWRELALANVGQGVGTTFDDELTTCKSKRDVRAVFERHLPKRKGAPAAAPTAEDVRVLADSIRAALAELEKA